MIHKGTLYSSFPCPLFLYVCTWTQVLQLDSGVTTALVCEYKFILSVTCLIVVTTSLPYVLNDWAT